MLQELSRYHQMRQTDNRRAASNAFVKHMVWRNETRFFDMIVVEIACWWESRLVNAGLLAEIHHAQFQTGKHG